MIAPGYETAAEAFAFLGDRAQLCAYVDGECVLRLAHGVADDALIHTYSVSKPLAALCVLLLVDRGKLALDDPVAATWPEFAQAGKDAVTVRQLLSHRAGVPGLRAPASVDVLLDWNQMVALLAAEAPWWPPGTAAGEHALVYGHLCGELVRRVDGRPLGAFFAEEVAAPWRLDFRFGLGDADLARTADLVDPTGRWAEQTLTRDEWRAVLGNPDGALSLDVINGERWRRAEVPAVNGHGTAEAIARFHAGLVAGGELDGVRLLGEDLVEEACTPQWEGTDRVVGERMAWGLGLAVEGDDVGMGGVGGSVGFANRARGLAYGYATTVMGNHDRSAAVERALLDVLDARA